VAGRQQATRNDITAHAVRARYPATGRAGAQFTGRRSDNGISDNRKIRREGRGGRGTWGGKLGGITEPRDSFLLRYQGVIFFRAAQVEDL
jgi:hypothetical protein